MDGCYLCLHKLSMYDYNFCQVTQKNINVNSFVQCLSSVKLSLFIICGYLYQSGYYSYLIRIGLGLGVETKGSFVLFNLCC